MKKKLYRNKEEGMFTGVLAGFSDYFGFDATLWRLFFIIFVIFTGFFPGILAYLMAWIVMPEKPEIEPMDKDSYVVSE